MFREMRTFWVLLATQAFSFLGSAMSAFAVGVWVYQRTGDATPLALAATFGVLPSILTTGWAGVAVDRYQRRTLMVIADAGQAVATTLLLISIASGQFQLWHLYLVAAIEAVFAALQFTALTTSITMLVPTDQRERANTFVQLTGPLSGILGPMLAAVMLVAVGVEGVLVIDLITFVVAVAVIGRLAIPTPPRQADDPDADTPVWQQITVGLKVLSRVRPILYLALASTLINYPMRIVFILSTPYLLERTGSEVALGTISGIMSAGMVVGGILFSIVGGLRTRMQTVVVAIMVMGLMAALHGVARSEVLLALTGFLMMSVLAPVDASLFAIMQDKVPPNQQGRAFAAVFQMSQLLRPLGYVSAGVLADQVVGPAVGTAAWGTFAPIFGDQAGAGMGLLYFVSGLSIALLALAIYLVPALRNMERDLPDYAPDPPPAHDAATPPGSAPVAEAAPVAS